MDLTWRAVPFELKATDESDDGAAGPVWGFSGLAACFHNVDESYWPDILSPGCFTADLAEFLASGFVGGVNHDWCAPIGKPLSAVETPVGLEVSASISRTAAGTDAHTLMVDGVIRRLSIGFRVLGRTWLEDLDEVQAYWQTWGYSPSAGDLAKAQGGARLVTRARLYEFSPVALPANPRATIDEVRGQVRNAAGGVTFEAHTARVAGDLAEWVERARAVATLRAADGRGLGEDRLAMFRRLRQELDVLLAGEPPRGPEVRRLAAAFEHVRSMLSAGGVQ